MFTVPRPALAGTPRSPEIPPSIADAHLPVRFLNQAVELADLLCEIVRLLLQLRDFERCTPLDLATPVAVGLLVGTADGCDEKRMLASERITMRNGVGKRSPIRELCHK